MKKIKNSFYEEIINIFKDENVEKVNKFIKNNLWITPLIYIIGTIALLIRNKIYGLQFTTITLQQFALIFVYIIIFLVLYALIEFNLISFYSIIKQKKKFFDIIGYIFLYLLYLLITFAILYILIDNYFFAIKLVLSYFIFWPIFVIFLNNKDILSNVITIIFFITLIMNIPISIGGFKGQNVIYHDYITNEKSSYIYYGISDGMYQFMLNDEIILIPIDSGYIKYKK